MLREMFGTLAGWLMFFLGVFLSGTVMGWLGRARSKVAG